MRRVQPVDPVSLTAQARRRDERALEPRLERRVVLGQLEPVQPPARSAARRRRRGLDRVEREAHGRSSVLGDRGQVAERRDPAVDAGAGRRQELGRVGLDLSAHRVRRRTLPGHGQVGGAAARAELRRRELEAVVAGTQLGVDGERAIRAGVDRDASAVAAEHVHGGAGRLHAALQRRGGGARRVADGWRARHADEWQLQP